MPRLPWMPGKRLCSHTFPLVMMICKRQPLKGIKNTSGLPCLPGGMLATRGMVGVKVKSNPPTIDECIEAVCSYFKHPIEWETVFLIAVYDASVKYDLLKAMSKLNRLEIAGELDGHTVLETVAALNRKYHGSVEKGIYPYTL